MVIKSLELKNYRNYEQLHIGFEPGTNILYGDNAQGKTNILEAVYLCSTTKSHRGSKDQEIISFGQEEAHIKMIIEKRGLSRRIDMHLKKGRTKGIAIDGIPIRRAVELFGIANLVIFSPEDLDIIKSGPAKRRRFTDMELCQLDKLYMSNLSNYQKIIIQRNKLLKELSFRPEYGDTLQVWDLQMVRYGKNIIRRRDQFISELNEIIGQIHETLTGGKEKLTVVYEPNVAEELFEDELERGQAKDIRQKMSMTGPHRDDISFVVNGVDIRRFGSQGQQRSAALSLKLAEIELVKRTIKDCPILLLDDVLSELDSSRQKHLLECIKGIQTIITCTGLDDFINHRFLMDRVFKVAGGSAAESATPTA